MTSRLRFLAPLFAALVLVAGCGSDDGSERASASTDANELLRSTFDNLKNIKSATVDLSMKFDAGSTGAVSATVKGPFETQGENKLPRFAMDVSATVEGQSFAAGATWTGEKAYVALLGTNYEVPSALTREFIAAYEEAVKTQEDAGGDKMLADLGIDFTTWLKDVRNEGIVKVGDEDAVKITGTADVARVVEDLDKIAEKASSLGAGADTKLTPQQKQEAINAVKDLRIEVYSGAEDRMLRRLTVNAVVDADNEQATIALDFKLLDVGKGQDINAPENARPFDELTKTLDGFGLGDLSMFGLGGGGKIGGGEDGSSGGSDGGGGGGSGPDGDPKIEEYAACIEEAGGDIDKAQACADILAD